MAIHDLPDDVLLHIALYLSIQDLLAFKQTCRAIHAFGSTDYLWHRLVEESDLLLDIPTDVPMTDLTADDLQRLAIQAIRLGINWRLPSPKIKRITSLGMTRDALFERLLLVPGGKWLLVVEEVFRRFENRHYTRVSFWSLANTQDARCVVQYETVGRHRQSAVTLRDSERSVTFAIALNHDDRDFIDVRTILLDSNINALDHMSMSSSVPISRRVDLPPLSDDPYTMLTIQSISVSEHVLVATAALIRPLQEITSRTLIALTDTGPAKWMAQEPVKPIRLSKCRLHKDHIVVFGQGSYGLLLRSYELPMGIPRGYDTKKMHPSISAPDGLVAWGPLVTEHRLSDLHNQLTDVPDIPSIPIDMLTLMFTDGTSRNPCGRLARFPLSTRSQTGSKIPAVVASKTVPLPQETSIRFVCVGATGRRAVWMEHSLETTRSRLMKLELEKASSNGQEPTLFHGVLLPSDPPLPFSTNSCQLLAFDEATCRLCLGLWDRTLHIVDFV